MCLLLAPEPGTAGEADGAPSRVSPVIPVPPLREGIVFRSAEHRFSVRLPGAPAEVRSDRSTLLGTLTTSEYRVDRGATELRIEVHEIPRIARWAITPRGLLSRAVDSLLEDESGRVVSERADTRGVHPVQRVTYRGGADGEWAGEAEFVLVASRLYVLATLRPSDMPADPWVGRFFQSFDVW